MFTQIMMSRMLPTDVIVVHVRGDNVTDETKLKVKMDVETAFSGRYKVLVLGAQHDIEIVRRFETDGVASGVTLNPAPVPIAVPAATPGAPV